MSDYPPDQGHSDARYVHGHEQAQPPQQQPVAKKIVRRIVRKVVIAGEDISTVATNLSGKHSVECTIEANGHSNFPPITQHTQPIQSDPIHSSLSVPFSAQILGINDPPRVESIQPPTKVVKRVIRKKIPTGQSPDDSIPNTNHPTAMNNNPATGDVVAEGRDKGDPPIPSKPRPTTKPRPTKEAVGEIKTTTKKRTAPASKRNPDKNTAPRPPGSSLLSVITDPVEVKSTFERFMKKHGEDDGLLPSTSTATSSSSSSTTGLGPLTLRNIAKPAQDLASNQQGGYNPWMRTNVGKQLKSLTKPQRNLYSAHLSTALQLTLAMLQTNPVFSFYLLDPESSILSVPGDTKVVIPLFYKLFIPRLFSLYTPPILTKNPIQPRTNPSSVPSTNQIRRLPVPNSMQFIAFSSIPLPSLASSSSSTSNQVPNPGPKTTSLYHRKALVGNPGPAGQSMILYQRHHNDPIIPIQHYTFHWYHRIDSLIALQQEYDATFFNNEKQCGGTSHKIALGTAHKSSHNSTNSSTKPHIQFATSKGIFPPIQGHFNPYNITTPTNRGVVQQEEEEEKERPPNLCRVQLYPSCTQLNLFTMIHHECQVVLEYGFTAEHQLTRIVLGYLAALPQTEMMLQSSCRNCVDLETMSVFPHLSSHFDQDEPNGTLRPQRPQCYCPSAHHLLFKTQLNAIISVIKRSISDAYNAALNKYNETKEASTKLMSILSAAQGKSLHDIYFSYLSDELIHRERDERGN